MTAPSALDTLRLVTSTWPWPRVVLPPRGSVPALSSARAIHRRHQDARAKGKHSSSEKPPIPESVFTF